MISWTLIYLNNLVSIDSSCPPSVYIQLRTWPFFSIQAVTLGAKFTASNYLPNLIWLCRGSKCCLFAIPVGYHLRGKDTKDLEGISVGSSIVSRLGYHCHCAAHESVPFMLLI